MVLSGPEIIFFLYFGKRNFLALRVKTFLYFPQKRFSYISGNGTFKPPQKKFVTFPEMELSSLIFQEGSLQTRKIKRTHCEKISYISGNGTLHSEA